MTSCTCTGQWVSSTIVWSTCCSTGVLNAAFLLKGASGMHTRVTPYRRRTQEEAEGRGSGCGCALTHSDSLLYAVSPIAQWLLATQTVFLGGGGGGGRWACGNGGGGRGGLATYVRLPTHTHTWRQAGHGQRHPTHLGGGQLSRLIVCTKGHKLACHMSTLPTWPS